MSENNPKDLDTTKSDNSASVTTAKAHDIDYSNEKLKIDIDKYLLVEESKRKDKIIKREDYVENTRAITNYIVLFGFIIISLATMYLIASQKLMTSEDKQSIMTIFSGFSILASLAVGYYFGSKK
jgi:hypothetical protein